MAAQSDWWWNFRPTGYNALAWSGSEGNAAQRFLLCSVVLKPTHTQLSPGKFLYYLWEIISESITDADEEASFRYGSDTDRMVGMSNPAVWIIHSDQPHSPIVILSFGVYLLLTSGYCWLLPSDCPQWTGIRIGNQLLFGSSGWVTTVSGSRMNYCRSPDRRGGWIELANGGSARSHRREDTLQSHPILTLLEWNG